MKIRTRPTLLPLAVTAALLAGCGAAEDGDDPGRDPVGDAPAEDGADAESDDGDAAGDEANAPIDEEEPVAYDEDAARERAEDLLGTPEDALPTDDPDVRVMRRGEEQMVGTMDLRPGRANLELDDDGSGTFVVTRVEVEVPDGDEPIVVE